MSDAQRRAYEDAMAHWGIAYTPDPLDLAVAFGRPAPVIFEIGFGMGRTTAEIAEAHPQNNYLGVEVHTPGVGSLLKEIQTRGLTNVRLIQHDAVEVLTHMLADGSLAGIHIYFPDPWPKKRHHKRRLIQPDFAQTLAERLKPGGELQLATDWADYARYMLVVLDAIPGLRNTAGPGAFASRPANRIPTRFEERGERLGHDVYDLVYYKNPHNG